MNNDQETLAAHAVIGCAQQLLCDMDGVLPEDFKASTTAILWRALEIQLGGHKKVSNLINQRSE